MSGIAGIVDLEGGPVEPEALNRLVRGFSYPGGAPWQVRSFGSVAFALCPLDVDGVGTVKDDPEKEVKVLCDARIDARPDASASDAELIRRAYLAHGTGCASQLLGDFSFALWDAPRRRLVCARSPFGVKPFFHACKGRWLVFSNILACVRAHPLVSDALDELSILDFLLVGHNLRPDASAFHDIARLAPGHTLSWDAAGGMRVTRHFDLPLEEPLRRRDTREYVEEFDSLLRVAVRDRVRGRRASVCMSGGLDSTSVAATARDLLAQDGAPFALDAFTMTYPRLLADDEGEYARLAAEHLGIPLTIIEPDRDRVGSRTAIPRRPPEPVEAMAFDPQLFAKAALLPRPILTGQGGDVGFSHDCDYASGYLREGRLLELALDLAHGALLLKKMPALFLRTRLRRALGKAPSPPPFPPWFDLQLEKRFDLRARFAEALREPPRAGAARAGARHFALLPMWTTLFEQSDPAVSGLPGEMRHPYFDLRLLRFLLRLPEIPWCMDKTLLRMAMRDRLPEAVRTRPKTPLASFPDFETLRRSGIADLNRFSEIPALARFVDIVRFKKIAEHCDRLRSNEFELITRPLGLAAWLSRMELAKAA